MVVAIGAMNLATMIAGRYLAVKMTAYRAAGLALNVTAERLMELGLAPISTMIAACTTKKTRANHTFARLAVL